MGILTGHKRKIALVSFMCVGTVFGVMLGMWIMEPLDVANEVLRRLNFMYGGIFGMVLSHYVFINLFDD